MNTPGMKHKFDGFEPEVSDQDIQHRWEKLKPMLPERRRRRRFWFFLFSLPLMCCAYLLWPLEHASAAMEALPPTQVPVARTSDNQEFETTALASAGEQKHASYSSGTSAQSKTDISTSQVAVQSIVPQAKTPKRSGNNTHSESATHEGSTIKGLFALSGSQHRTLPASIKNSRAAAQTNPFQASNHALASAELASKNPEAEQRIPHSLFFMSSLRIGSLQTLQPEAFAGPMSLFYRPDDRTNSDKNPEVSKELELFAGAHLFSMRTDHETSGRIGSSSAIGFSAGGAYHYVTPKRLIWSAQLLYQGNPSVDPIELDESIPLVKYTQNTFTGGNYRVDTVLVSIAHHKQASLSSRHSLNIGAGAGYRLISKPRWSLDASLMVNAKVSFYRYDYHSVFGAKTTTTLSSTYTANWDSVYYQSYNEPKDSAGYKSTQYRAGINLNLNPMVTLSYKLNASMALILKAGYCIDLMDQRVRFKNRPAEAYDDDVFRRRQNNLLLYAGLRIYLSRRD